MYNNYNYNYILYLKKIIQQMLSNENKDTDKINDLLEQLKIYTNKLQEEMKLEIDNVKDTKINDVIPSYMFFDENIQKTYGICPVLFESTLEKQKWLNSTKDKGNLFYIQRDYYLNNNDLFCLQNKLDVIKNDLFNFHKEYMVNDDFTKLYSCISIFTTYFKVPCKSKRIKYRFNTGVNILSELIKKTSLPLHIYISILLHEKIDTIIEYESLIPITLESNYYNICSKKYNTLIKDFQTYSIDYKKLKNNIQNNIEYMKILEGLHIKNNLST